MKSNFQKAKEILNKMNKIEIKIEEGISSKEDRDLMKKYEVFYKELKQIKKLLTKEEKINISILEYLN